MMPQGGTVPPTRPPSPFLILLFGLGVTTLAAEWMRFQFGAALLLPVAAFGTAVSFRATVGAYRMRRAWRTQRSLALAEPATVNASTTRSAPRTRDAAWNARPLQRATRERAPTSAADASDVPLAAPPTMRSAPAHTVSEEQPSEDILADPRGTR